MRNKDMIGRRYNLGQLVSVPQHNIKDGLIIWVHYNTNHDTVTEAWQYDIYHVYEWQEFEDTFFEYLLDS